MDHRHKFVNEKLCAYRPKPAVNSPCFLRDCSSYKWQVGAWSECSKSCGFGRKHRSSMCLDVKGNRVSSHLCDDDSKPKVTRRCSEFPCPFMWTTGQWSECSRTCGEGKETRKIICQAVTKEGWILPGEVQYGCRLDEKPASARYCNNGDCDASTHWEAGPWGQCSASCGSGLQRRQVMCVDNKREKTKRKNCFSFFKPPRLRSCFNEHCYATSCKELKQLTTIRKDGDYQIKIGSHLVRIYCKDMRKKHPKEYITLIHGPSENYAEMFDKKLKVPSTCPYDGKRPEEYCTKCRKKIFDHAGNSTFSKIRINLASLTIITTDTEFTKTHFGNPVPYASGGDCYSSSNCPQGRFSINLVDTGFVVSINTTWTLQGNRASQRIWRLRNMKEEF
ncbi:A disintegrin and metalloproteinase with thrombospondin motifs 9 [Bulinus truncatus]|nr:A disintegrin and metalloproteinase with thrombospondin motifs 9 [Bulinus truncatus]